MKDLNLDDKNKKTSMIIKSACMLFSVWITGCASHTGFDKEDYYDPDHERLNNTDMSSYTVQQFSEVNPLCLYDEHCRAIDYGNVGCSGLGGFVIYSTVMGGKNIASLVKVASRSRHREGVLDSSGLESVCLPAGPRKPLLYCDDVCINAFDQLSELQASLYRSREKLKQCQDIK